MVVVGLTGGIGSGKSTVAGIFSRLGARVLSADHLAKDVVARDPDVRDNLILEFGSGLYSRHTIIDSKILARIVFNDKRALKKLNAIVHPAVISNIRSEIKKYRKQAGLFLIEAALFYETGIDAIVDYMLVIDAGEGERIRRVMRRDDCRRTDVMKRIAMQMPAPEKVNRADFVIINSGSQKNLRKKCVFLYRLLRNLGNGGKGR